MKKESVMKWAVSLLLMGLMALAAEWTGKQEIIFPETAALLTGCFLVPQRPWNVPHGLFTLQLSVCGLAGTLISRYMPVPLYFKILLAVAFVSALLIISRAAMLPSISACALPVLIGTTDFIYVFSVVVIAAVCDLGNYLMEQSGMMKKRIYARENPDLFHWLRMLLIFALVLVIPMLSGFRYMVAPPLIVAFVSLCGQNSLDSNPPVRTVLLFTGTSLIGFSCRTIADVFSMIPQTVWIMGAAAVAWFFLKLMQRFFPPAAAIAILPFILPEEGLWRYPLEVMAGIAVLYCAARVVVFLENDKTVSSV